MFSAGNEVMYRITPACAGKTNVPTLSAILPWDHPRVCGKNQTTKVYQPCKGGSPPRVREKLLRISLTDSAWGITPACAGKTLTIATGIPFSQDHPRVCGKNEPEQSAVPSEPGSPPRVREKLCCFIANIAC